MLSVRGAPRAPKPYQALLSRARHSRVARSLPDQRLQAVHRPRRVRRGPRLLEAFSRERRALLLSRI